jgi:hypothetical protein
MLEYNLTQRERQILVQLSALSQQSKDSFEALIVNAEASGPTADLVRIHFAGQSESMVLSKRDLRVLKDEGLIHFHWHVDEHGSGRLSSLAIAAVSNNFQSAGLTDAAELAASIKLSIVADEDAIELRFQKITAELVSLARQLIDADEALSAKHEAMSIAEELKKGVSDEAILTRKIKGFVSRLSLTFSGTVDLARKGEIIGQFGERLAAWLVALSIWTEWHAAHPHRN